MKKISIVIIWIMILIFSFYIGMYYFKMNKLDKFALVSDECTEFAKIYELGLAENIKVNAELLEKEKEYVLRIVDGNVVIYIIENNKENLKEVTNISIQYLPQEDILKLEQGIKVTGEKQLNSVLEDFE